MKTLLTAINAKFIHTCPAVRYLKKYADGRGSFDIDLLELTINNHPDLILDEIFRRRPQLLGFSCYIWNISLVRRLLPEAKKILPGCTVVLGGPEVSYESEALLRSMPAADYIIRGEGEEAFYHLLRSLTEGQTPDGPGLTFWRDGEAVSTPDSPPFDLASLPFPYEKDLSDAEGKIKYYESSRGCPFRCQYCLSSVQPGVRFVPLEKALKELQIFLDAKVPQVKFIDRTFNCDKQRALAIWSYLRDHDNGVTNFHFEIEAELLDGETVSFLSSLRPELFQLEIGVQSTNPATLAEVRRRGDFDRLSRLVKQIDGARVHRHLDLIAGLPHEDYRSFARSFDDVYRLEPEQFQLGFLKLLRGSGLYARRRELNLLCREEPPYEILSTDAMEYAELLRLKGVEEMVERYYNSGRFRHTLRWLLRREPSPFAFYERLGDRWIREGMHLMNRSLDDCRDFLYHACREDGHPELKKLAWYLKYDLCLHQRPRRLPDWMEDQNAPWRAAMVGFLADPAHREAYLPEYASEAEDPKQLYKLVHLEHFPFDPLTGAGGDCFFLFNYKRRDLLGNARAFRVPL
jgi:radical SAM superfamily enzyme YgiQ (UPF0313 family)